jgi:hypothetical protein
VARQQSAVRQARLGSFDLERYLASHRQGGQAPLLSLTQFGSAANDPATAPRLAATDVRLDGFVVEPVPGGFSLARLQLGCCAGDAVPIVVEVEYTGSVDRPPSPDQWVQVEGRFSPEATARRNAGPDASPVPDPVFLATSVSPIDPPDEPYEYPF